MGWIPVLLNIRGIHLMDIFHPYTFRTTQNQQNFFKIHYSVKNSKKEKLNQILLCFFIRDQANSSKDETQKTKKGTSLGHD